MKLEQTIQTCFDKHPTSFDNRKQVLIHLFCLYGTEFEWKNGELVNAMEDWDKFNGILDENGKAKQWLSIEEVALKLVYKNIMETGGFESDISYETFSIKMNDLKIKLNESGMTLEDTILKDNFKVIHLVRDSHEKYIKERMCKKYSPLFNIPKDITKDWTDGLNEAIKIVTELGVCLEDIT